MATMVQDVVGWLGAEAASEYSLAQDVRHGLSLEIQQSLLAHGLTREEFHRIVIPQRTFRHRTERRNKGHQEVLSPEESDKAVRAARILSLAERVFAAREKALSWMRQPKKRFHGDTPMTMLETETGARLVEQMLIQIDDGMFA